MSWFRSSSWKNLFPSSQKKHSLACLNLAQFFGVINDNLFKFVMAFLLIDALGSARASEILAATGAVYVIPFLLFSSSAGILADRFSKQRMLFILKIAEILIMSFAMVAFYYKSIWGCYSLLFLLSTHSAMFGPPKYGIIPELVPSNRVSKANGLITSFTYLAIIIGTFLASFLTDITDRRFIIIAGFCLCVAIAGFASSLGVKYTPAQSPDKKINLLFVREIYRTLVDCRKKTHLLTTIFGAAYFLFIGAFTQLNIIPFAIESLHLNEVDGGYLFLSTALGIAFGAFIAGKLSKQRIELGISCWAGFGIALFFFLLPVVSHLLIPVIICLVGIGILGGLFIVPFETFIQLYSENEKRGQTIAAANFLSFFGVLLASISLYVLTQIIALSSATSFGVIGWTTLAVAITLTLRLSDLSLSLFSRKCLHRLFLFHPSSNEIEHLTSTGSILVLEKSTWLHALLLIGAIPQLNLFIPTKSAPSILNPLRWFHSFHLIPEGKNPLTFIKENLRKDTIACFLARDFSPSKSSPTKSIFDLFSLKKTTHSIALIAIEKDAAHARQLICKKIFEE